MPSLRCICVNNVAQRIVRPILARTPDPVAARADFERFMSLFPVPRSVRIEPHPVGLSVVPDREPLDGVIVYIHGGGYICGSPHTHRALAGHLARRTGRRVILPRYRLAPESQAPAAFEDVISAIEALGASGIAVEDMILGGDSAGGGLALAALAHLGADGRRPRALFAFSPWTDLTGSGESMRTNARSDRILPVERFGDLTGFVIGDGPANDPRVSPLFADYRDPPPVLIQVAQSEVLYDDARRMVERLRRVGGSVRLFEIPDAPHVWQLLGPLLPEARQSFDEVASFLEDL